MEDAHAAVLDLQPEAEGKEHTPTLPHKRLAYFGVYDGHGGEKVAQFAGDSIHKIVAKQDAFKSGDMEQALKDGFLATDRAILNGQPALNTLCITAAKPCRSQVRRRGLRLHCFCRPHIKRQNLGGRFFKSGSVSPQTKVSRQTLETHDLFSESKDVRSRYHLTTNRRMKVCISHNFICILLKLILGEKARIVAAGGFVDFGRVNGNLALSRAIGDFEFKKSADLSPEQQIVTAFPDVVTHEITHDDEFLVIACDGVPPPSDKRILWLWLM